MKKTKLVLPKVYNNDSSGRYPQHLNKPKLSYSQITSWKDPLYSLNYIRQYFMGIPDEGNIFSSFGSLCGEYYETKVVGEGLSEEDIKVLDRVPRPPSSRFEVEIVVDRGSYCIQGFIDRESDIDDKTIELVDLKTGNVDTKIDFYGGASYQQTTLYCYQRVLEGKTIGYSGVYLLGRKGNGYPKHPLRLSGVIEPIETPYSEDRAEKFLESVDKVAQEISDLYKLYLKVNVL